MATPTTLTRDELLVLLIEECAEVIQAATKCLRFGFSTIGPAHYGKNSVKLSAELGDVYAVVEALPLDLNAMHCARIRKLAKAEAAKREYLSQGGN